MTTIPVTILDNFLNNPDTIRNWGLSLPFESSDSGRWPGKRTECLSIVHPLLFNYINLKILSLFFENPIEYRCNLCFQLVEDYQGEGWIHQDENLFTFIIYLSEGNEINCGTSLYNLKPDKIYPINSPKDHDNLNLKNSHYQSKTISPEMQKFQSKYLESNYEKSIDIKDKYNRLLCFSSELFHKANYYSNNSSPRLTLIGFIHEINTSSLPIIRSKQTLMV